MGNTNLQMGMDWIDNATKSLNKQSIQPNRIGQLIKTTAFLWNIINQQSENMEIKFLVFFVGEIFWREDKNLF